MYYKFDIFMSSKINANVKILPHCFCDCKVDFIHEDCHFIVSTNIHTVYPNKLFRTNI